MKLDDIYKGLKEFAEFSIPNDALASGHGRCIELLQEIRKGQDYCTFYLNLCYEQLAKTRKNLLARQRDIKLKVELAIKAERHKDIIKSAKERYDLIKLEAENEVNLTEVEEVIMKLDHLKDALTNTLSNLRAAKEQLNMALKVAQMDWEMSKYGQNAGKAINDENF